MLLEKYQLVGSISLLAKKMRRFADKNSVKIGLTGVQGRVLGFIFIASQWRELYQKDVEEEFDIRRSSATGILQLLEKNGLIKRLPVPSDARLKKIVLTEKALQLQQIVLAEIDTIESRLRVKLTTEEVETFVALADRIRVNLDEMTP